MRLLFALLVLGALAGCQRAPPRAPANAPAKADSFDLETTQERAQAAYGAGDWAAAEPHYVALARAMPQDAELWFRLGNVYARTDKPDLAIAAYRETLVRKPDLGKAWFNMGVVQLRQAANSFNQIGAHVPPGDPSRAQAADAYAAILAILASGSTEGDAGNAAEGGEATAATAHTPTAVPAPAPAAAATAAPAMDAGVETADD